MLYWPRRDLNTQPSDLESDPLPLRHGVIRQLRKIYQYLFQIIFIGDSTNRGMMHYLIERANGSLTTWNKTHDTIIYRNLNSNSTRVAFAYYPQFWLDTRQRPTFEDTVADLINR